MDVDAVTKRELVDGVESITVANSVKPATSNITDGERVHEVLLVRVAPKGERVPQRVVRLISKANQNKIVVVDGETGELSICEGGRFLGPVVRERLVLHSGKLDRAWDSIVAQVALRELDGVDVWARIERREKIEALQAEMRLSTPKPARSASSTARTSSSSGCGRSNGSWKP